MGVNETLKCLSSLSVLVQNHSDGARVAITSLPSPLPGLQSLSVPTHETTRHQTSFTNKSQCWECVVLKNQEQVTMLGMRCVKKNHEQVTMLGMRCVKKSGTSHNVGNALCYKITNKSQCWECVVLKKSRTSHNALC